MLDFTVVCTQFFKHPRVNSHSVRFASLALGAIVGIASFAGSRTAAAHESAQESSAAVSAAAESAAPEAAPAIVEQLAATPSGCGKLPIHSGMFNLQTTDGRHVTRTFLVHIPPNYNHTHPYPLIFVFHGAGANSSQSYSWGLQNVNASNSATDSGNNGIFVFPDGVNFQSYGVGWDDLKSGYDMPFFDNMLTIMKTDFCLNTKRVFVAGFSWGGDFVTALSCARAGVIRATVANSTTDEFGNVNSYSTYDNLPCPAATTHPAIRFEHAVNGDGAYPAPRFATTSALFRHFNACSTAAATAPSSTSVMSCKSYNACADEYIECSFNASIGHALPPNWAADTWAFFSKFN
jgi:polyhydroxybutyrate depolymerase